MVCSRRDYELGQQGAVQRHECGEVHAARLLGRSQCILRRGWAAAAAAASGAAQQLSPPYSRQRHTGSGAQKDAEAELLPSGACLLSARRDRAGCTRMHLVSAWHMAIIFGHRRRLPSKPPRAAPHSLYH